MHDKKIYLNGLNGLRAIAALSVLFGHVSERELIGKLEIPSIYTGFDGVTLFFVISGFLITYLLLQEKTKTSDISISKFYMRRILRIWPLYYGYIFICFVFLCFFSVDSSLNSRVIWLYIFFAANVPLIINQGIPIIIHYWSLGVEEQFYLIWPWFMKLSKRKIVYKILIVILLLFILKSASWYFLGNKSYFYRFFAITRFHCMLIGSFGAVLFYSKNQIYLRITTNKFVQLVTWGLWLIIMLKIIQLPAPLSAEVSSIIALLLIMGQIVRERSLFSLENNIVDFLGKISYGIYVIHPLVIMSIALFLNGCKWSYTVNSLTMYVLVPLFTISIAYLSYEHFEKRFLLKKKKFTVIESSNSRNSEN